MKRVRAITAALTILLTLIAACQAIEPAASEVTEDPNTITIETKTSPASPVNYINDKGQFLVVIGVADPDNTTVTHNGIELLPPGAFAPEGDE